MTLKQDTYLAMIKVVNKNGKLIYKVDIIKLVNKKQTSSIVSQINHGTL